MGPHTVWNDDIPSNSGTTGSATLLGLSPALRAHVFLHPEFSVFAEVSDRELALASDRDVQPDWLQYRLESISEIAIGVGISFWDTLLE